MTLDTSLNLLGLIISLGGLIAARLTRQVALAIFASALIVTTGVASWLAYEHGREVSRVENELKAKLAHNRWTLDRIHAEMREPNYRILREALARAVDNGAVGDQRTECTVSDGSVLTTRVYFNIAPR